ncbi:MAG: acyl carrier protein, partial [Gaiellaceae bacterium]
MERAGISERVQRLFQDVLERTPPSEDTDLIASGLMDSLALVELLVAIETEFGVDVPLDELEIDSFRSIRTISE